MPRHRNASVAVAALLLASAAASVARAQETSPSAAPEHRFEIVGPSFGAAHFAVPDSEYSRGVFTMSADVRYAHASGHGLLLRGTWGSNLWGEGYGLELDYLFRAILAGDRHVSLGLDLTTGLAAATIEHDEQTIAPGAHFGGNAGLSVDLRLRNFTLSAGAQYRLLLPTEDRIDGGEAGAAHLFSATLGAGFSFY